MSCIQTWKRQNPESFRQCSQWEPGRKRPGRKSALAALLLTACAGTLPPDATPRQLAREECRTYLGRTGFSAGLRRGTARWDQAVELCTARYLGPAGEIDRAAAALEAR